MRAAIRIAGVVLLIAGAFGLGLWTQAHRAVSRGSATDAADGARQALATSGSLARAASLLSVLQAPTPEEMESIASVFAREISTLGECEIAPFADAWVSSNTDEALAGIGSWPYALKRAIGLRAALEALASREPQAALARFDVLAERHPGLRSELQIGLVSGWASTDPAGLRVYLQGLPEPQQGGPLGLALGMIARHHGVEALLAWSEVLITETADPLQRAKIFRKTARTAARREPLRAAAWVAAHAEDEYAADGLAAVAEAWILVTPAAAIEWLEGAQPAEKRAKALELAFGRWLHDDRPAATEWLDSVARTPFHDPAVASFARNLARRMPAEAVARCEQVLGVETREQCLVSVGRTWFRRDPAAAASWLANSPLDEEARASLRARATDRTRPGGRYRVRGPAPAGSS